MKNLLCLILLILFPCSAHASDGWLKLYNIHTHERLLLNYRSVLDPDIQAKINWFFRSWSDKKTIEIDLAVLEYLDMIQDQADPKSEIEVISGYRSDMYNRLLKKKGRGVAQNSYHTRGQAIDFRIRGMNVSDLSAIAWQLQRGGVGHYSNHFIHIDSGPVRGWPAAHFRRTPQIAQK